MQIGKLFQINKYYWFLYPSKEIASAVAPALFDATFATTPALNATFAADYLSKKRNCNVSYISPKSIFMLLEQDEKYCKILSTNGELGWIKLVDLYSKDIEEVKV